MGFLRFLLAVMVMLSHMGLYVSAPHQTSINQGVSAVVVFYLLAGHVVCRLWRRFPQTAISERARAFYTERIWRIAPLYLYALGVATAAWSTGVESYFVSRSPGWYEWLQNVMVIPLNFYMFSGIDRFTLLPPAWSLGAELQFYLLIPLLLCRWPLAVLGGAASLGIFAAAQTGWLNADIYGYRLLGGVLFVFLAGGLWQRRDLRGITAWARRGALGVLCLGLGVYAAVQLWQPALRTPYTLEVALGFALGLPMLAVLSRLHLPAALHRGQQLAGALSYGVFLLHFPVIWLLERYAPPMENSVMAVLAGSTVLAAFGHFAVERPIWARFRRRLEQPAAHSPGTSPHPATATDPYS